jgi:hypothetical protein
MSAVLGHDGYREWLPIAGDDTNDLPNMSDGVWITTTGNLSFVDSMGNIVNLIAVPVSSATNVPLPISTRRIRSTGTTAVGFVLRK